MYFRLATSGSPVGQRWRPHPVHGPGSRDSYKNHKTVEFLSLRVNEDKGMLTVVLEIQFFPDY